MARKFAETINRHGGKATLIELPKLGIKGNTHFLMQDLNNDVIAAFFDDGLQKKRPEIKSCKKAGKMREIGNYLRG